MLKQPASQHGFSLIELMVAVAIAGVLLAVAAPSFSTWLQNSRIRNEAQDIFAGVQQAKAVAVQRNIRARFQLTTDLSGGCALSTTGTAWVVSQVDPATPDQDAGGQCNAAVDTDTTPRILSTRPAESGNSKVVVNASDASMVFNSLGRLTPAPAADLTIDISGSSGTCATAGGDLSCLRIIISPAGQPRLCNPRFPADDPQGC